MAEHIYGGKGVLFWITQLATFAILILAANTAYQGFPGLSSIIARDGYLPRQLANRGDKLVFSNGIIFLAVAAGILIVIFKGNISALIPLYAFGVFTGFTLSQAGMVRAPPSQSASRTGGRRWRSTPSAASPPASSPSSSWCPSSPRARGSRPCSSRRWSSASAPSTRTTARCATSVTDRRAATSRCAAPTSSSCSSDRSTAACSRPSSYAKSLAPERLIAVSVVTDAEEQERLAEAWTDFDMPIQLHTIASPYRELTRPVLEYLDELDAESPDDVITVVIPEFVTQWKTQWLHNQSAFALKARLLYRPNTVVTSVPVLVEPPTRRAASTMRCRPGDPRRQNGGDAVLEAALARQAARGPARPAHRRPGQAIVDLPGVAEGTEGKVILANGFNWQRYRVRFPDGTELGDLDQRNIDPIGRAAKRLAKAAAKPR